MPNAEKLAKKNKYFAKLIDLCENHPNALIVHADHVGSKQMQNIRLQLRGHAVVLMGKNTMIRKALANRHEENPEGGLDKLRAIVKGNIGFIFATNCTLDFIQDVLSKNRRQAAAKAGVQAPVDVVVPAGPTGMDPSQTSFFQALNIATQIVKGQVELKTDTVVCQMGNKVSASEAALLTKLNIKPFEYGLEVQLVYQDGCVFDEAVLRISDDVLIGKFMAGVANMAAFSREIGIPTEAALPQMFANAFKNIAALVSDIDFTFKQVEEVKKFLEDPDAYAAANPVAAAPAAGGGGGGAAPKKEEKKVVEEEEEEDMEFDLFD